MKKLNLYFIFFVMIFNLTGCGKRDIPTETQDDLSQDAVNGDGVSNNESEEITQNGPSGSIMVTVPDGWNYDLCDVNDDKLYSGEYGIHIYPEDADEGYIEIGYHSCFGVCGTGLETKEMTLAGDKACVGYFDGHSIWDFVNFSGENENIVAMTYHVDGWKPEYIEQSFDILDTVHFE